MKTDVLKAPFPWFGGKSRCADGVWAALGAVDNYVEAFAGSLAVLLGRPDDCWQTGAETVNDKDYFLSNFWRALAHDPEQVAQYADWPVNECDLVARHLWLVNTGRERIQKMELDPDFYDVKVAGWWVWGLNCWIGSGWCSGAGPHTLETINGDGQLPHLGDAGQGVNRQLPHLGDAGQGVNRQRPHLGDAGHGVNRQRPHLVNRDQGGQLRPNPQLTKYLCALATRLRRVRVCCGDWSRVVTTGALAFGGTVGIFLDPPYDLEIRNKGCYNEDSAGLAVAVREWAIANGGNPRYRIVLAGYEAEHALAMPDGWRKFCWKANRAYGSSTNANSANNSNRKNERLWFSPHCLNPQPMLL